MYRVGQVARHANEKGIAGCMNMSSRSFGHGFGFLLPVFGPRLEINLFASPNPLGLHQSSFAAEWD